MLLFNSEGREGRHSQPDRGGWVINLSYDEKRHDEWITQRRHVFANAKKVPERSCRLCIWFLKYVPFSDMTKDYVQTDVVIVILLPCGICDNRGV